MNGVIFDVKHYAIHDGPGIRQSVFFKGCPLSCWWCHNPESQACKVESFTKQRIISGRTIYRKETVGYEIDADSLFEMIEGDTPFFDESGGGVTFSGGEPLMQPDFLKAVAEKCKTAYIHTALDTCGYASQETFLSILPYMDLVLFDLKLIDDELHQKYTGVSNVQILENLHLLAETDKEVKLRFPVIPGITDTSKNLEEIEAFLNSYETLRNIDILPYHNISRAKYKRFNKEHRMGSIAPGTDETSHIKNQFEAQGFNVTIGG